MTDISKRDVQEYEIQGKKLICPFCGKTEFWTKSTLMNTRAASFFDFDWANKEADNYICDSCGYIMWFWPQE